MVKKRIYSCIVVMRCTHCKICATKYKYIFPTYRHRDIHKTNKNISLLLFLIFRFRYVRVKEQVCVNRYMCQCVCVWIVKLLVERLSYITRCTFDAYAQSSLPSMSLIYGRDYLVKTSFQSNRDKKCWYVVQRCFLSQIMQVLRCLSFDTENETFLLDNLNLEFMSISSNTFSRTIRQNLFLTLITIVFYIHYNSCFDSK